MPRFHDPRRTKSCAKDVGLGSLESLERAGLGARSKRERLIERTGLLLRLCRGQRAAQRDAQGQASAPRSARGRPRPRRNRPAPALAPRRRSSSAATSSSGMDAPVPGARRGDPGRSPDRSLRPARGERLAALIRCPTPGTPPSGPADGGTRRRTESQQAVAVNRVRCRLRDPEPLAARHTSARSPVGSAAATSNKRRASRGKSRQPPREALLDLRGQGQCRGQTETTRELGRRHPARQLQESQRVPVRLGDEPSKHVLIERTRQGRAQSARASRWPSGPTWSSGNPASASPTSRAAKRGRCYPPGGVAPRT